ncbi:TPA: hypothetical protein ACKRXS_002218 [Proteus mirabilis]|nr:hypothetical protein [Proteus mirabilis]HEJ9575953.1 hypothetical protein [Proteus mirabilis]
MKERGIIFNAEMVRAILDGRKTQTRRVMNNQPCTLSGETISVQQDDFNFRWAGDLHNDTSGWFPCPLGKIGDRLWVRETWRKFDFSDECGCSEYPCGCPENGAIMYRATQDDGESKWRPSIHMPRRYSRILLEITNVRVERLNDISNDDAKSEGCWYGRGGGVPDKALTPSDQFPTLWEEIYGDGSWSSNPWVWVIEFRKVD